MIFRRYLLNTQYVKGASADQARQRFMALVSLFRQYGRQYSMDWMLMAAQGHQESRLDHSACSHVGAIGVMQVMLDTGKELAVGDITKLEPNRRLRERERRCAEPCRRGCGDPHDVPRRCEAVGTSPDAC